MLASPDEITVDDFMAVSSEGLSSDSVIASARFTEGE